MHVEADGILTTLNAWINTPEVLTLLVVAAVSGSIGWLLRTARQGRRFGWNVLYDEPINQGDPSPGHGHAPGADAETGQSPTLSQNMWEIVYQESDPAAPPYKVTHGSLVVLEMRNIGWQPIREADFDDDQSFTLRFPGRNVVHFKVRDNLRYHQRVHLGHSALRPGEGNSFTLPALQVNRNDGFKLLVLLESPTPDPPATYDRPQVDGSIQGGKFMEYGRHPGRTRKVLVSAVALAAVAGTVVGVALANRALAPAPVCASGKLDIEGSTAFAPVFNEVATEYEQHCPGAQITVRGVGSVQGLKDLEQDPGSAPIIAMYDGSPKQAPDPQYVSQAVGVIIFAVVGNRSLPANLFEVGKEGGLTNSQITQAFQDPHGAFVPVGRSSVSGTREAFVNNVLNGDDSTEQNARPCPSASGVCLESTTMELLTYVNQTPQAIGYAEADALPFFPNVGAIPINGYEPTRANALNGDYAFLTTEHLYTNGIPSGLAADLINFLTSSAVTAQIRDTSFIACTDLGGSNLSADCRRT
jgi:ABC-type phosphate transport system substrate-binding protein